MTHTISHYPTHLIDVLRLAGQRIVVRPALPQDGDLQRAFFAGFSDEARYFRFMTRLAEPPAALAERFSNVDHIQHVALLAGTCTTTDETMVGEAPYVVEASDPETCEFAVAVADAWRGAHLARTLLERLAGQATAAVCGAWWPTRSRPMRPWSSWRRAPVSRSGASARMAPREGADRRQPSAGRRRPIARSIRQRRVSCDF